ncbi:hypothetical protein B0H13DRAFT_1154921 [Mycena leptocephala]|nr:hypothetical protein B0H13DRAFT_1154921 [Mycena leptocephala]
MCGCGVFAEGSLNGDMCVAKQERPMRRRASEVEWRREAHGKARDEIRQHEVKVKRAVGSAEARRRLAIKRPHIRVLAATLSLDTISAPLPSTPTPPSPFMSPGSSSSPRFTPSPPQQLLRLLLMQLEVVSLEVVHRQQRCGCHSHPRPQCSRHNTPPHRQKRVPARPDRTHTAANGLHMCSPVRCLPKKKTGKARSRGGRSNDPLFGGCALGKDMRFLSSTRSRSLSRSLAPALTERPHPLPTFMHRTGPFPKTAACSSATRTLDLAERGHCIVQLTLCPHHHSSSSVFLCSKSSTACARDTRPMVRRRSDLPGSEAREEHFRLHHCFRPRPPLTRPGRVHKTRHPDCGQPNRRK